MHWQRTPVLARRHTATGPTGAVHDPRSIEGAYHAVTARHVHALAEDLYLSSGLVRPEPGPIFRMYTAAASAHVRLFTLARRLVATTRPHLEGCVHRGTASGQ
jgi:hypothetical protein